MTNTTSRSRKNTTQQGVDIKFYAPRAGAPQNLLANATLVFRSGLLAGLWMPGFALWRAERASSGEKFVSVTVPAREADGRYYDWLRGNQKKLKAAIVAHYERWAAAERAKGSNATTEPDGWEEQEIDTSDLATA